MGEWQTVPCEAPVSLTMLTTYPASWEGCQELVFPLPSCRGLVSEEYLRGEKRQSPKGSRVDKSVFLS